MTPQSLRELLTNHPDAPDAQVVNVSLGELRRVVADARSEQSARISYLESVVLAQAENIGEKELAIRELARVAGRVRTDAA